MIMIGFYSKWLGLSVGLVDLNQVAFYLEDAPLG